MQLRMDEEQKSTCRVLVLFKQHSQSHLYPVYADAALLLNTSEHLHLWHMTINKQKGVIERLVVWGYNAHFKKLYQLENKLTCWTIFT